MATKKKIEATDEVHGIGVVRREQLLFWVGGLDPRYLIDCRILERLAYAYSPRAGEHPTRPSNTTKQKVTALLQATRDHLPAYSELGAKRAHGYMCTGLGVHYPELRLRLTVARASKLFLAFRKGRGRSPKELKYRTKHAELAKVLGEIIGEPVAATSVATYLQKGK